MSKQQDIHGRVADNSAAIERLELIINSEIRQADNRRRRNPTLGITKGQGSSGLYPAKADSPNVYPFRFIDAEFNEFPGAQPQTVEERQEDSIFFGATNTDLYLPEDTIVWVLLDNDRYWLMPDPGEADPDCQLFCFIPGGSEAGDDAVDSINGIIQKDIGTVGRSTDPPLYDFTPYSDNYFQTTFEALGVFYGADFTFSMNVKPRTLSTERNFLYSSNGWELYITASDDDKPSRFEIGFSDSNPTSFKLTSSTTLETGTTYKLGARWDFVKKEFTLTVDDEHTTLGTGGLEILDSKDFNVSFGRSINYTDDLLDGEVAYFKWYCSRFTDTEIEAEDGVCGCCSADGSESGPAGIASTEKQKSDLESLSKIN